MNSRERALAAFSHKTPDRVPLSIGTTSNDCFTKAALKSFAEYTELGDYDEKVTWKVVQTVVTPETIQKKYGADFRAIRFNEPDNPFVPEVFEDGTETDVFGVRIQGTEYYYDAVERPLLGCVTLDDIKNHRWPDAYDKGLTRGLKQKAKDLYDNTDYALVVDFLVFGPFEGSLWVRGWDDFLCDLYAEPKMAEAVMDKFTDYALGIWDQMLTEVGDYVHLICQGDDLGMQDRSLISKEMYDKYVKKYMKRYYDFIRSKTDAVIMHHSCGSCYELIPSLLDCGVQALNPIQISATNMEPERLKKEFGKDIVFWGGLDVQKVLPFYSTRELDREVERIMRILGEGGGYVFAPSHNIQPGVPVENMKTLFESAVKHAIVNTK